MRHSEVRRSLLLERADVGAEDELTAVQDVLEALLQLRRRGPYCAAGLKRGIRGTPIESRGTPPQHQIPETDDDQARHRVLDVPEGVMEALPVLAHRPADAGEREATWSSR